MSLLTLTHISPAKKRGPKLTYRRNRYVRTSILPESAFQHVEGAGVAFASAEDGGKLLLRILGDGRINGRQLFMAPRKWAAEGYLDFEIDDYEGNELLEEIQRDQLKGAPVEEGLFLPQRW